VRGVIMKDAMDYPSRWVRCRDATAFSGEVE
jgi:hypothetical protein